MRLVRWIAACGVILAACGGGSNNGGNPLQPGTPVLADTVTIVDNAFGPAAVTVSPGGTVTWIWAGSNQHNVQWSSGPGTLPTNSPTQATGMPYTVTFNDVGTYRFACSLHSNMGGTVFVAQ